MIIETAEGRVSVPAKAFLEQSSTILGQEVDHE